jgi:hypothetical protein
MRVIMAFAAVLLAVALVLGDTRRCQASLVEVAVAPTHSKIAAAAGAVFPNVVPDIYATMDAVAARQQACMDQYIMNIPTRSNGKLTWEEYYARCDEKLVR